MKLLLDVILIFGSLAIFLGGMYAAPIWLGLMMMAFAVLVVLKVGVSQERKG